MTQMNECILKLSPGVNEKITKSYFSVSETSQTCVGEAQSYLSHPTASTLSVFLTSEQHPPLQSITDSSDESTFNRQLSNYNTKDNDQKVTATILTPDVTTSSNESFEAGTSNLKVTNGVHLSHIEQERSRVTDTPQSDSKIVPRPSRGRLGLSQSSKPQPRKAEQASVGLKAPQSGCKEGTIASTGTFSASPSPFSTALGSAASVRPNRTSSSLKSNLGNSKAPQTSARKSTLVSRTAPPAQEQAEHCERKSPPIRDLSLCVIGKRLDRAAGDLNVLGLSSLESASGAAEQQKAKPSAPFFNIIRKKISLPTPLSPNIIPAGVSNQKQGEEKEVDSATAQPHGRVFLIPRRRWGVICSKWYRRQRARLGQRRLLFMRKRASSPRAHRKTSSVTLATKDCLVKFTRNPSVPETKKPVCNIHKLRTEKPNGNSAVNKEESKPESATRKSLRMSPNLSRSRLPLSPTPDCAPENTPPASIPSPQRAVNQQQNVFRRSVGSISSYLSTARTGPEGAGNSARTGLPKGPRSSSTRSGERFNTLDPTEVSRRASLTFREKAGVSSFSCMEMSQSMGMAKSLPSLEGLAEKDLSHSKFVIIPHLSSEEERERTATVVFDLDETLCNNRVFGPPILRPGAAHLLRDLRASFPRPRYKGVPYPENTMTAVSVNKPSSPSESSRKFGRFHSSLASCNNTFEKSKQAEDGLRLELVLWTASIASTAKRVVDRLDPCRSIFDQIIYQDARWYSGDGDYTKELRLLGRNMARVVIVENAPPSVKCNRRNAILVTDFSHNLNDRQLLVVRSILVEWLNVVNSWVLRKSDVNYTSPLELGEANSEESDRKTTPPAAQTNAAHNNPISPRFRTSDLVVSSRLSRRSVKAKHLPDISTPASDALSPNHPGAERAETNIAQFLSLHKYMQNSTNYIRLSVVPEVSRLYQEAAGVKLLEKSNSARRPLGNGPRKEKSSNTIFPRWN